MSLHPGTERTAFAEADPEPVGRVLLLYSGGLDTSVMLRWIREHYDAEIVTLTVDLGQPDEDWEVVVGKARDLGAVDAILVDARDEFA
ncbi:MAG TPA: argininosuccinate synthase domain-containing protein, partial [Solirubrobacterales bacterium]|nr:argininosuccinate synthase domain-containing protein [Solirubrobacterales bacterium]